ncbi:MAG: tRNA pseudouridine(55) synthase TruB [Bacteroidales bacterium]|nr:MAG: tRNA pseudouridine(55) synthase TruB [Bacteroidales bacterium]
MVEDNEFKQGIVLFFNKPLEWTSFDLVKKVKNTIEKYTGSGKIKVGHAGTLDPLATGLMILCTGRATKRISEFQNLEKEYIATLELGKTTPSFDRETSVDAVYDTSHVTEKKFIDALGEFKGEIRQIPPLFSAKNIRGERAYKLARTGGYMDMNPVRVSIRELEILDYSFPRVKIRVVCSKGTYIRALVRDIGQELKCGAYMTDLVRVRIGMYHLGMAQTIQEFEEKLKFFKQN